MKLSDAIEKGREKFPDRAFGSFFDDPRAATKACDLGCAFWAVNGRTKHVTMRDGLYSHFPRLMGDPIPGLPTSGRKDQSLFTQIANVSDFNELPTSAVVAALREAGL